jgi:hypothetical protein
MNDTTTGRQAAAILAGLGWPTAVPTGRLVASVFDRAMRSGMFEAEVIMGYMFDRREFPAVVSRDDRLTVAMYALCRFAADIGQLEDLRFDGSLASDGVLRSDEWTSASPTLPSMRGLYEAAGRECDGARFGGSREPESRK